MHSTSQAGLRGSLDFTGHLENHERIKREVKASYQIDNKGGSPRHGLILMSTPFYNKHASQRLFRHPILPYRQALSRKPLFQLNKLLRSRSTPKRIGEIPEKNADAREQEYKMRRSDYSIQNQLSDRDETALKNSHTILSECESKTSNILNMSQYIDQLKQSNQQALSNLIKEKKGNKQMEKILKNTKSKPLDFHAIEAAFPKITQYDKDKSARRFLNTSSNESDPSAKQDLRQNYYLTEPDQEQSYNVFDRSDVNRTGSTSKERARTLSTQTNLENRHHRNLQPNGAPMNQVNLNVGSVQSQQLVALKNSHSIELSNRGKVSNSQNSFRTEPPESMRKKTAVKSNYEQLPKRSKSEAKFLRTFFNPLYHKGEFVGSGILSAFQGRPKISKKYKNSVSIKYPHVLVENTNNQRDNEVSFDDTSVDTDTYKYYSMVHKEYFQKRYINRAERYHDLMKMNIADVFEVVYEEVDRVKGVSATQRKAKGAKRHHPTIFLTRQNLPFSQ